MSNLLETSTLWTIESEGYQMYPQYVFHSKDAAIDFLRSEDFEYDYIKQLDIIPLSESLEALCG